MDQNVGPFTPVYFSRLRSLNKIIADEGEFSEWLSQKKLSASQLAQAIN